MSKWQSMADQIRAEMSFQISHPTSVSVDRAEMKKSNERENTLRNVLAREFGEIHDWRLTTRAFSLSRLARGMGGWWPDPYEPITSEFLDHPFYYTYSNRAAAIVAHPYNFNKTRSQEFAKSHGLVLYLPDFPSWHYPGWTKLVCFVGPQGMIGINKPL